MTDPAPPQGAHGPLSPEEAALLRTALGEIERNAAAVLAEDPRRSSGRYLSNLEFLNKAWDIEVDFNREEGSANGELWRRHFEEINRCWNLRYASPKVSGPDDQERHVQLLREMEGLTEPPALSLDYRPTSHRRFIGRIIVGFKRLFFHLLQPYLEGMLDLLRGEQERAMRFQRVSAELHRETVRTLLLKRQTDFNAEVVRLLNELTKYVLFVRQKRFNRETKNILEAIPGQIDEVYRSLDARLRVLEDWSDRGPEMTREVGRRQRDLLQRLEETLSRLTSAPEEPTTKRTGLLALGQIRDERYQEFEDLFRGSRSEIMRRQRRYLGYFLGCSRVVDLGCGRGEFLELCRDNGIGSLGVDLNSEMVRTCSEMGLQAVEGDLVEWLRGQNDGSLDGLFSAQVIEHLDKETLFALLGLAYRKLRPGAYLILETLNTDNLMVASRFYADITHVRPIPSSTLEFLAKSFGFRETFVLYSSPVPEEAKLGPVPIESSASGEQRWALEVINANFEKLNQAMYTYQDYALVARRPAEPSSEPPSPGREEEQP
jgi:2-polyprenyl-3-methyl-5-hydroxy-6-metoxy-1,4-benzoquinol methylase